MTKDEAIKQVAAAGIKHEKKYGTGSAKMEVPTDANAIVLVAYFPPKALTHKQAHRGKYGLGCPIDVRGHTKKEPRREVRYAVFFETPKPGQ